MLIKAETTAMKKECLKYDNSDGSDENYEEDGELEIDLDYNDFVSVSIEEEDEPLDLSMKRVSSEFDCVNEVQEIKVPKLEILPIFNFSVFNKKKENTSPRDNKGTIITEKEVINLLEPYVRSVHTKFSCTVCDMKFATKVKALTHVENKHVDCLQYKCPLCRISKVTRLGYESHLRRGHGARVKDYCPLIRCKKKFCVKPESQRSQPDTHVEQPYDLEFVTFLRHILNLEQEVDGSSHTLDRAISCAEWIDQDQGIFRINNRQQFAMGWYTFKGLDHVSWDCLYSSVITVFIKKNIFKQLSAEELVFQVFCIKQLLK